MSRCFPYPPPGYVRNPVAVAEAESTAKLQKERGKAEKKKEKRSDKKAVQQGESSKHSKHSHKKRKHEDISATVQEPKKVSEESVEQLEKSGLSEEHGAPCFTQTVHDSPESSQDSSKRRKVVLPSPSQAKNGNVLRIKIKSNPDSPASVLEKPQLQQMGSGSSLLGKQNSIQHQNIVNVKSTAAAQQRINGGSQAVEKQVSTQLPAKFMQRDDPQTTTKVRQRIDPQLSVKEPVESADFLPAKMSGSVLPPARGMGRVDPPPAKTTPSVQAPSDMVQKVDTKLSPDIQRKCPPASAKLMPKETSTSEIRQLEVPQPPLLQNPKVELPVIKQHQQSIPSVPKEEPCSSGRNLEAVPVEAAKQSRSDRKKSRKVEKKEKKFRDLFVTWNPLLFEMEGSDLGEQDWLLGSTRKSDASMRNCRASDCLVPIQPVEQQSSLQPRATFLPDLNIYQLPYVVPF